MLPLSGDRPIALLAEPGGRQVVRGRIAVVAVVCCVILVVSHDAAVTRRSSASRLLCPTLFRHSRVLLQFREGALCLGVWSTHGNGLAGRSAGGNLTATLLSWRRVAPLSILGTINVVTIIYVTKNKCHIVHSMSLRISIITSIIIQIPIHLKHYGVLLYRTLHCRQMLQRWPYGVIQLIILYCFTMLRTGESSTWTNNRYKLIQVSRWIIKTV